MSNFSRVSALLFVALAAGPVSAKEFVITTLATTENSDGNRIASDFTKNEEGVVYELLAATSEVNDRLTMSGCSALVVEGSVLSRSIEIDHENHRDGVETIKILARSVSCRKVIRPL